MPSHQHHHQQQQQQLERQGGGARHLWGSANGAAEAGGPGPPLADSEEEDEERLSLWHECLASCDLDASEGASRLASCDLDGLEGGRGLDGEVDGAGSSDYEDAESVGPRLGPSPVSDRACVLLRLNNA
jgi:hypothetical protein